MNLPQYHMYIKLLIDGTTSRPFSATTLPLPEKRHGHREQIIQESRKTYSAERQTVQQEIVSPKQAPKTIQTLFDA